jgi:hypothetical protein
LINAAGRVFEPYLYRKIEKTLGLWVAVRRKVLFQTGTDDEKSLTAVKPLTQEYAEAAQRTPRRSGYS